MTRNGAQQNKFHPTSYKHRAFFPLAAFSAVFGLLLFLNVTREACAAELFFEPPLQSVSVGEAFELSLMLDTENEEVNALEGALAFSREMLQAIEIYDGGSIVDVWVQKPSPREPNLFFAGIMPGGFRGVHIPLVDQSFNPGKILVFKLRAQKEGTVRVTVENARVLFNDGYGTEVKLSVSPASIHIANKNASGTISSQTKKPLDTTPPEPFIPIVARDPLLYDGMWVVIFATQDTNSGVSYYEVYESKQKYEPGTALLTADISWKRAESPSALSDQRRSSYVYVKAVDNSGNARVAYAEPQNRAPVENFFIWGGIMIVSLFLFLVFLKSKKTR